MPLPKISIIVPVYNSEQYIKKCVESLLAQSYTQYEIILIDDASNDSSGKICDLLSTTNNNIIVLHNKFNKGVSFSRNVGINISSGEWICFVDSDDWVDIDYLKSFFEHRYQISKYSMLLQGYASEYPNRTIHVSMDSNDSCFKDQSFNILFKCSSILLFGTVCSKLYSSYIIKKNKILFDESMRLNEDNCFFWHYLSLCNNIIYINNYHYHYRHEEGINYSKSYKSYDEYIYIMFKNKKYLTSLCSQMNIQNTRNYNQAYSQYISRIWFHSYISAIDDPKYNLNKKIRILENTVLPNRNEWMHYKSKSILKFLAKYTLILIMSFTPKNQIKILSPILYCAKKYHLIH